MRLPKSPEERRAAKAARQARWRERAKQRKTIDQSVNRSLGLPADTRITAELPKEDAAKYIRERLTAAVAGLTDGQLLDKDVQPAIANLLRAEGQIEAREKAKAKVGNAELAFLIIDMLRGGPPPAPALEDGMTIEGEAHEVD